MWQNKSIFYSLLPKFLRKSIKDKALKKTILDYYDAMPNSNNNEELQGALNYLKENKLCVFPYAFQERYKKKDIEVFEDKALKLKYVIHEGKRLYFRKVTSVRGIKRAYRNLQIEQDLKSPHRYLDNNFVVESGSVIVDIGAAEGNFVLSVIEKVQKAYLFETDEEWIEALKATFAPWIEKIEIVNKFVSNKNNEKNVSLDQFFHDKPIFNFLKIDAEGSEGEIFEGCNKTLSSDKSLRLAVCCYHKPNDEIEFKSMLTQKGFSVSVTPGYMIFPEKSTFYPPFLRRGVIRAIR